MVTGLVLSQVSTYFICSARKSVEQSADISALCPLPSSTISPRHLLNASGGGAGCWCGGGAGCGHTSGCDGRVAQPHRTMVITLVIDKSGMFICIGFLRDFGAVPLSICFSICCDGRRERSFGVGGALRLDSGFIDGVVPEPNGADHGDDQDQFKQPLRRFRPPE